MVTSEEWIQSPPGVVPCPKTIAGEPDLLRWMEGMRRALHGGKHGRLHGLASEGSRIPVEVDAVKLLQVELDAKNWTLKANKWLPKDSDSKRGKLADIQEHVEKASVLRDKITVSETLKDAWILEGEAQLASIVDAADIWLEQVRIFLHIASPVHLFRANSDPSSVQAILGR